MEDFDLGPRGERTTPGCSLPSVSSRSQYAAGILTSPLNAGKTPTLSSGPSGAIGRLRNGAESWIRRFCAQPSAAGVTLVRALPLPRRDASVSPARPWRIPLQGILGMWASEGFFSSVPSRCHDEGCPWCHPAPGQPPALAPSLTSAGDATGARGRTADTAGFVPGIPGKIKERKKKEKKKKIAFAKG